MSQAALHGGDPVDAATILALLDEPSADWRHEALLAGIKMIEPRLVKEPIALTTAPGGIDRHPLLLPLFAWPGHTPAPPPESPVRSLTKSEHKLFVKGRQIYLTSCVACHAADGSGTPLLAPPLAGSDWVLGNEERLVRVLLHGLSGPITVSGKHYTVPEIQPEMPPLATLGNTEIGAVLTYLRRAWGNAADPITSGDLNRIRIESQGRTTPWTEKELKPYAGLSPEVVKTP